MPHELEQRVATVRQRWNRRSALELACWLAAAVIGLMLAAGVVDFVLRIADRGLRILLTVAIAAAASWVGLRLWRAWRGRRWSEISAAQHVQSAFPQLGDRLASSLEFLRQEEDDPTAGSAPLRRSVVADTTAALHDTSLERVADSRTLPKAITAAAVAMAAVVALAVANPTAVQTALARLAAPWNTVEWPRRTDLAFVDPPTLVARGGTFEASLVDRTGRLPEEVQVEYRYETGGRRRTEQAWMQRVGDLAVARRENVQRSFEYRAVGGDHHTMPWTAIEVVDPPSVRELTFTLHPPTYSGLPLTTIEGETPALAGSGVELLAQAKGPLSAATLETSEGVTVPCELQGADRSQIVLPPRTWKIPAAETDRDYSFHLRLVAENGLVSDTQPTRLRVVVDHPPEMHWSTPADDLNVVSTAVVPLVLEASDDLAIHAAELIVEKKSAADEEQTAAAAVASIELYAGDAVPPARSDLPREGESLDKRRLEHEFDLALMNLSPGSVVDLRGEASDYQPATGATARARRLTVITLAELESELAGDQAEILRLLEQALADQRSAHAGGEQIAGGTATGAAERATFDGLVTTRLGQQSVRRTLTAPTDGVVDLARAMLRRLTINRLDRPELASQLDHVASQVERLDKGPLPTAEQQLTDLRKQFEPWLERAASGNELTSSQKSFSALDAAQQEVITTLEELIDQASAWSDADRFVRELARLEQEEREQREATQDAARRQMKALADRRAAEVAPTEFERLAAAQSDVARRFSKLMQAMRQLAAINPETTGRQEKNDFKKRLEDAIAEAEASNLAGQMADGARAIDARQLGRAADSQQAAADKLRDLVELLRDRRPTEPSELANRLRELQQELAGLQRDAQKAAEQNDSQQQDEQRESLADNLERLARKMNRMTAPEAGQSAAQAAESAAPTEQSKESQESLDDAQKKMQQAQQQLAERIAELEDERQQRLLERLAQVLDDLVPRQQTILEDTLTLEQIRETNVELGEAELQRAGALGKAEANLAQELSEAILDLAARAVFQLALEGAAGDMRQASDALERRDTGHITQQLELAALARMRHVRDVLRDEPPPPSEPQENGGGEGGEGGQGEQRPPLIELAEVKMLRWLQVDLNGHTRLYEADLADNPQTKAAKLEAAQRLAEEQNRLEELVREMMRRNNNTNPSEVDL